MSKFYGQVSGAAQTVASRRGHQNITTSAQSWDGSVITRLHYNENGELMVAIDLSDGSSSYGKSYFYGTFEELKTKLGGND